MFIKFYWALPVIELNKSCIQLRVKKVFADTESVYIYI